MANKFQAVFAISVLNERGNQLAFCQRQRLMTPFRLGLSVIASMATEQVPSIAALYRNFNALWAMKSSYKAFYNQLATPRCPDLFRTSLCDIMGKLAPKVLGFEAGQAFGDFKRLVMQDGSSFALHDALASLYPGRFNAVKPAAVELHCTMDLLQDAPITIALSPDTDAEHDYRPEPASLTGDLFLADRGYLALASLRDIDRHGGFFLVRGKAGLNPRVIDAFRQDGQRLKSCQDRDFQAIIARFPKRQQAELDVEWLIEAEPFRLRLIVRWNAETQSFAYLLTKLPHDRDSIRMICLGYKLRWQVEVCQTQPIKMTWCPLRLFRRTRRHLRGRCKRENELDVHRFSRHDDFADQALGYGLTFCKRELSKILAQQLAKGLGIVHNLLPMDALMPRLR